MTTTSHRYHFVFFPSSPVLRGKPNRNQRFSAPPGEARSAGHPAAPSGGTRPRAGGDETFLLMDFTPRLFPRSHLYLEAESLEKEGKTKKKNHKTHKNPQTEQNKPRKTHSDADPPGGASRAVLICAVPIRAERIRSSTAPGLDDPRLMPRASTARGRNDLGVGLSGVSPLVSSGAWGIIFFRPGHSPSFPHRL